MKAFYNLVEENRRFNEPRWKTHRRLTCSEGGDGGTGEVSDAIWVQDTLLLPE